MSRLSINLFRASLIVLGLRLVSDESFLSVVPKVLLGGFCLFAFSQSATYKSVAEGPRFCARPLPKSCPGTLKKRAPASTPFAFWAGNEALEPSSLDANGLYSFDFTLCGLPTPPGRQRELVNVCRYEPLYVGGTEQQAPADPHRE
jgi:hypothetical protein